MRIGIDVRCLAEGKRTGVEEYTLGLLKELFARDTENEYILFFNAWRKSVPDFTWIEAYPRVTLRVFHFPNKLLNLALWYFRYPKLDLLLGGVDIFFLPNLNFVAISRDCRLVVTAHDLSFELFPETFSWKQRLWHYLIDFRRLARTADRVIAVSRSTRADLMTEYGVADERIVVIPSGVDPRFAPMDRNSPELMRVKEKYHLPYRFILYLGTFEPRKNIRSIIEAYETLRQTGGPSVEKYELVIAGTPGWKCEDVREATQASPYRDHIHFPGFIADADKVALYNLASVFVYPSFYEGFGFPPLEAMACGVPVIVSHTSSLPEVVGQAGLMIDPYQPDELYRAMREILRDPGLLASHIREGKAQASGFSWGVTADRTQTLFASLVKDGSKAVL